MPVFTHPVHGGFENLQDFVDFRNENLQRVNLAEFNTLCTGLTGNDAIIAPLCGVIPSRGIHFAVDAVAPRLFGARTKTVQDIDFFLMESSTPPCADLVSLYTAGLHADVYSVKHGIGKTIEIPGDGSEDSDLVEQWMDYASIPNRCLARFGLCSRFKLNIFFPRAIGLPGTKKHALGADLDKVFVEKVLLPSIAGLDDPAMVVKFPLDMQHCQQLQRTSSGHTNLRGTYCSSSDLDAIVLGMVSILQNASGTLLDPFKDFFFVSHAHGLKIRVDDIQGIESKLPELQQSFFSSASAIFVDYAMEMFSQNMFGQPGTSLFQISSGGGSFGHSALVQDFFQNHYSEKKTGGKYRRDQFMNLDNLGGFDFKSHCESPVVSRIIEERSYPYHTAQRIMWKEREEEKEIKSKREFITPTIFDRSFYLIDTNTTVRPSIHNPIQPSSNEILS
ncbi:hypothetical protein [Absidia glauca]|uniref:Uncharacterized protein n=1 Tax=Absidia glauca TaxID=4829 RepID=A0A168LXA3_ABSGL|nr:hypothetical protein [Absidia glauca]